MWSAGDLKDTMKPPTEAIELAMTQLYQTITKEHLDPDNKTTTAQWDDFVGKFQDNFARECSEIAQEMFGNHNDEESA